MNGIFNMKISSASEKSKGVLLFAFNTVINKIDIDYVKIAERSARLITHTTGLPVTLVTDTDINSPHFDNVVCVDNTHVNYKVGQPGVWRNGDRFRAYELSPYDQTLLIDSDYLMLDQNLLKLFDVTDDYRIMSYNHQPKTGLWPDAMGAYGLQYQWATVVLFNKCEKSKMLFDLVGKIQRNHGYYNKLYHGKYNSFRNDYAFTIANNILNGYSQDLDQGIVWPMLSITDIVTSLAYQNNFITIKEKTAAYVIPKQNIHVMDKAYLLSDNFSQFLESVCVN